VRSGSRYRAAVVCDLWETSGVHASGDMGESAEKKSFPTVEEWRLDTEPWIFVVDGQGIIRAKFEGLMTLTELEAALQQTLQLNASGRQ
jgi:hypothetical protein